MSYKTRILFLCTGNSCRSQMAEAWTNHLLSTDFQAWSAGVRKSTVDSMAAEVMAEAGVDMRSHHSKLVEELPEMEFDYVITLCDHARESCPFFTGRAKKIHKSFEDPPRLAEQTASPQEALDHYRRVRDEIKEFVLSLAKMTN